jgi:hypothetical protein
LVWDLETWIVLTRCSGAQVGQYGGLVEEVESLKRDKNVLMMELVHLRQRQQVRRIGSSAVSVTVACGTRPML